MALRTLQSIVGVCFVAVGIHQVQGVSATKESVQLASPETQPWQFGTSSSGSIRPPLPTISTAYTILREHEHTSGYFQCPVVAQLDNFLECRKAVSTVSVWGALPAKETADQNLACGCLINTTTVCWNLHSFCSNDDYDAFRGRYSTICRSGSYEKQEMCGPTKFTDSVSECACAKGLFNQEGGEPQKGCEPQGGGDLVCRSFGRDELARTARALLLQQDTAIIGGMKLMATGVEAARYSELFIDLLESDDDMLVWAGVSNLGGLMQLSQWNYPVKMRTFLNNSGMAAIFENDFAAASFYNAGLYLRVYREIHEITREMMVKNEARIFSVAGKLPANVSQPQAAVGLSEIKAIAQIYQDKQNQLSRERKNKQILVGVLVVIALLVSAAAGAISTSYLRDVFQKCRSRRRKNRIRQRLSKTKAHNYHFDFVRADKIRGWQRGALLRYQDLKKMHGWLQQVPVDLATAILLPPSRSKLVLSHRWFLPNDPDPDGQKVKVLQVYLKNHLEIRWVWCDFWCLPQKGKEVSLTEDEEVKFRNGLANVNLLYLACWVLCMIDFQYVGRFWTSFEFWLASRCVQKEGLRPSPVEKQRVDIRCFGAAAQAEELLKSTLQSTWGGKTAEEAAEVLRQADITVTNQGDKDMQLEKLIELAEEAPRLYEEAVTAFGTSSSTRINIAVELAQSGKLKRVSEDAEVASGIQSARRLGIVKDVTP